MPSEQLSWMERNNLSPGKAALIAVLAIVFICVVAYQLGPIFFRGGGGGGGEPAVADLEGSIGAARKARQIKNSDETQTAAPLEANRTGVIWPTIEVADVVDHDPFRLPAPMRNALLAQGSQTDAPAVKQVDEAKTRREQLLAELMQQGVDIVILDKENAVASIGALELRVGDVFEGLLVKRISRNGVELERIDLTQR